MREDTGDDIDTAVPYGLRGLTKGSVVYSLLWVMQELYLGALNDGNYGIFLMVSARFIL